MSFKADGRTLTITPLGEEGEGENGPGYKTPFRLHGDVLEMDHRPVLEDGLIKFSSRKEYLTGLGFFATKFHRYKSPEK